MFDGLKETLGRFREDVEEQAEETEEAAETPDAEAETPEEPADAERTEAEADERATMGDRVGTDESAGAPSAPEPAGEPGETVETEASDAGESDQPAAAGSGAEAEAGEPEAEGDEGRGIAERAKLFATGKAVIDEDDLEGPLEDLELALIGSDVSMEVADDILDIVRERLVDTTRTRGTSVGDVVSEALRDALVEVMSVGQFDFDERVADAEKPMTIVFTGVNGVGKTTTIAKLARRFEEEGYSVVLANGDTYRAGANEQLREHAENLGVKLISHEQGGDPAAVIYDAVEYAEANDVDIVLGDTAGRLHTSNDLMTQLEKIDRVVDPDMTLFVDEAVSGQDAVNRAREFDDAAEIDGTVLTKADADSSGGAAISVAHVTGKPVLFLGVGQGYDDLERFDPEELAAELV